MATSRKHMVHSRAFKMAARALQEATSSYLDQALELSEILSDQPLAQYSLKRVDRWLLQQIKLLLESLATQRA